jgi:aconitate hydratase
MRLTGRAPEHVDLVEKYLKAQELFGIPKKDQIDYTKVVELDLKTLKPSVAGPKRPQDLIALSDLKERFTKLFSAPIAEGGYEKKPDEITKTVYIHSKGSFAVDEPLDSGGTTDATKGSTIWSEQEMLTNRPFTHPVIPPGESHELPVDGIITHGSIVIAAITSCTNTSNPFVMIGAGLLAKKAVEKGLAINPMVKTSLAPGSRVVTDY